MILHHIKLQTLKAPHLLWDVALCPWFFQFLKSFHVRIVFCFATDFLFLNSSMCCGIFPAVCRGWERTSRIILHCKESKSMEELHLLKALLKTVQLNISYLLIPAHHPRAHISSSHSSFEETITSFAFDSKSLRASLASCDHLGVFRLFFQDFFTPLFMETLLAVVVINSKLYRQIFSIFAASFLRGF